MIKFRTLFNENSAKQLNKHTMKKHNWGYILVSALLIALGVFQIIIENKSLGVFFILFGIIFTPLLLLVVHTSQKEINQPITLFRGETVEIYEFTEDEIHIQTNKGNEYFSLLSAKYSYLYRVEETQECYFLYISKIQSHVIDKRFLIEGSIEQLNELFAVKLGVKFKPCRKK